MIKKFVIDILQNKNIVMFLTAFVYILGISAYFTNSAIIIAGILSVFFTVLLIKNYVSYKIILFWIFMFYFAFVNCNSQIKNSDELYNLAPLNGSISGEILSIPNSNYKDKTKFYFKVDKLTYKNKTVTNINAKTLVTVNAKNGDFSKLKIGNYYKLQGNLRKPFKASNPSQFDYGKYLRNFDTFTVFYSDIENVKEIEHTKSLKTKFLQSLNDLRIRIVKTHAKYLESPKIEILGGIIFGDDAVAPPEFIKKVFINSGLLHILAASGMNVAFIYGFWYFILNKLKVPYKLILSSGIGVIVLYSLMTGLGASVIRAAFMLIFILVGKLIDRDTHSVALLSFVALLMLIYNPAYLYDVGFQLSFLVTFGLLTTADIIFEKIKKVPQWLSGAVLIPIIAQFWVIPLQMFYFNTISIYSVFANIITVPFLSVISFLGFLSSVLSIFTPIADFVCKYSDIVLNPFLDLIVLISNYFSSLKNSLIYTPHPSILQVFMYYIIILLITLILKLETINKKIVSTTIILITVLILSCIKLPSKDFEMIAFDVQNADAFLLKTPENKYFMIDTGKAPFNHGTTQAEAIIIKYLRDNDIKNLEGLIITHFDSDHSGGAADILDNIKVKTVYINSLNDNSYTSKEIYKRINKNYKLAKNLDTIYKEPNFEIITYRKPQSKSDNENSIITLVKHKNINILMMGDASMDGISNLPDKIQILKVGHHGAKSVINTNMLKAKKTEATIISTGFNTFGHPNPITIKQLENTKIYRTDKNNSVKISSNGDNYLISAYNSISKKYIP